LLLAPLLPSSCVSGLEEERPLASLDEAFFRCKVQPVLTKNCATFACHGNGTRFFRLFGRNRLRLGGTEAERNAFLRDAERATNFTSTRAFVDVDRPEESLLLMKPLAEAAGGYYHGAADDFAKRDVFISKDDPEYQVLVSWVQGAKEDPACIEPGSDL
jgi:hypothetical protein